MVVPSVSVASTASPTASSSAAWKRSASSAADGGGPAGGAPGDVRPERNRPPPRRAVDHPQRTVDARARCVATSPIGRRGAALEGDEGRERARAAAGSGDLAQHERRSGPGQERCACARGRMVGLRVAVGWRGAGRADERRPRRRAMGDKNGRPDTPMSAEAMFGPARPVFSRARKGYDPGEVRPYLDMLERERSDLGAALVLTQARVRELAAKLERYEALEQELTRSVHLAKETADAVVADAEGRAAQIVAEGEAASARHLAEGRATIAEESRELDALHMAIAAEAATLASLEDTSNISRAAAALVEIVDKPEGLGPFSQATSTLLEFAQLLLRTARAGVDAGSSPATVDLTRAEVAPVPPQPVAPGAAPAGAAPGLEVAVPGALPASAPADGAAAPPHGTPLPAAVS
ncbi:MAG: hypothetical protein GEV08_22480 [Acidimicrobiia bacterium]|nr:hypothetical protein [Acidimicrobiia bacterium]